MTRRGGAVATESPVLGATRPSTAISPPGAVRRTAPTQTLTLENFPQPILARALSPNGRAHWGQRNAARKTVAAVVAGASLHARLEPVSGPVRLTFRWVFPTRARRDLDNLSTGVVKSVLDCLVRHGTLADDDSRHVVELKAEAVYEKGRRALEIIITEAT